VETQRKQTVLLEPFFRVTPSKPQCTVTVQRQQSCSLVELSRVWLCSNMVAGAGGFLVVENFQSQSVGLPDRSTSEPWKLRFSQWKSGFLGVQSDICQGPRSNEKSPSVVGVFKWVWSTAKGVVFVTTPQGKVGRRQPIRDQSPWPILHCPGPANIKLVSWTNFTLMASVWHYRGGL
jgi:hypothetical protein